MIKHSIYHMKRSLTRIIPSSIWTIDRPLQGSLAPKGNGDTDKRQQRPA